jgi:hypothetical protein
MVFKQIRKSRIVHKYWSEKKDVLSPILFNGMMGKSANKGTGKKQ